MFEHLKDKMTRKPLKLFVEKNKSNLFTLDVGCSNSLYSSYFTNRLGFDINFGNGVDVVGDAHKLPFKKNQFDIIFCTEVFEHLSNPQITISEMKRVLKSQGKLILTTRFIFPLHDTPNDYWRFTKYGLIELFKGWEILELNEDANTFETIGVLLQRISFQSDFTINGSHFFVLILAKIFSKLSFLTKNEYGRLGDKKKQHKLKDTSMLTSGYYLICKNIK